MIAESVVAGAAAARRRLTISIVEAGSFQFAIGCLVHFWANYTAWAADRAGQGARAGVLLLTTLIVLIVAETGASFLGAALIFALREPRPAGSVGSDRSVRLSLDGQPLLWYISYCPGRHSGGMAMIGNTNTQVNPQTAPAPQRLRPSGGGSERPPAARPAAARPAEPPRQEPADRSNPTNPSDQTDRTAAAPVCPACGKAMLLRTARKGPKAGSQFWGCSGFPECRKTLQV